MTSLHVGGAELATIAVSEGLAAPRTLRVVESLAAIRHNVANGVNEVSTNLAGDYLEQAETVLDEINS